MSFKRLPLARAFCEHAAFIRHIITAQETGTGRIDGVMGENIVQKHAIIYCMHHLVGMWHDNMNIITLLDYNTPIMQQTKRQRGRHTVIYTNKRCGGVGRGREKVRSREEESYLGEKVDLKQKEGNRI